MTRPEIFYRKLLKLGGQRGALPQLEDERRSLALENEDEERVVMVGTSRHPFQPPLPRHPL